MQHASPSAVAVVEVVGVVAVVPVAAAADVAEPAAGMAAAVDGDTAAAADEHLDSDYSGHNGFDAGDAECVAAGTFLDTTGVEDVIPAIWVLGVCDSYFQRRGGGGAGHRRVGPCLV